MELVGAFTDREIAKEFAMTLNGRLLVDPRAETAHLPFAALVSISTDQTDAFVKAANIGAYVCFRRTIKPRASSQSSQDGELPGKIATFPMVRRPSMSHEDADAYWRDKHAPLALRVHQAMSFYTQLSIVHTIHGPQWDGIAQCGFDTMDDLRMKFYGSPAGQKEVEQDIVKFADPGRSPRRLICNEYFYD